MSVDDDPAIRGIIDWRCLRVLLVPFVLAPLVVFLLVAFEVSTKGPAMEVRRLVAMVLLRVFTMMRDVDTCKGSRG